MGREVSLEAAVPRELDGERLDKALAALGLCASRREARAALERGAVYLDGSRVRTASRPVRAGARLRVEGGLPPEEPPPAPVILWEEEGLVALDKPGGFPLSPTRESVTGCLLYALARSRSLPLKALHPLHRLDTPTSGIVLIALDAALAARLSEDLQAGLWHKVYLARVLGTPEPPEGLWDWPLAGPAGGVVHVAPGGRPALTRYATLSREGGGSLLRLEPETGRTHQLRVHCAAAGCPVEGDRKYGRGPHTAARALLHAWRLTFPWKGAELTLEAAPPADLRTVLS